MTSRARSVRSPSNAPATALPPSLRLAAPAMKHAYWAHANRQFRRVPKTLGETLEGLYADGLEKKLRIQGRVAQVLDAQLPPDLVGEISMGSFRGGTLVLRVVGGSWAFHLRRSLAERLMAAFLATAPDLGVRRIRFKVG